MRYLLLALASFATHAEAQREFSIYPNSTTHTTRRGNFGAGPGELHNGVPDSHFRGVGSFRGQAAIVAVGGTIQDQNAATQESFFWVVRSGTTKKGPTPGSSGVLGMIGPMNSPPGTGTRSWRITTSFASPLVISPTNYFSFGFRFPGNPRWPLDGLSMHFADCGVQEKDAQGTTPIGFDVSALASTQSLGHGTWNTHILIDGCTLQLCTAGAGCGIGGLTPAVNAVMSGHAQYSTSFSGGTSLLALSLSRTCGISAFPGAPYYLGSPLVLMGSVPIDGTGKALHPIGTLTKNLQSNTIYYFQALGTKGSDACMTNSASLTF